uniref:Uncharacterized protein n=1 Tax=Romanomermis culicivorax TaxID=13658 RepID=A0A915J3I0_ROMCU
MEAKEAGSDDWRKKILEADPPRMKGVAKRKRIQFEQTTIKVNKQAIEINLQDEIFTVPFSGHGNKAHPDVKLINSQINTYDYPFLSRAIT